MYTNSVFASLVTEENEFLRELKHRGLTFGEDFSYDVVLKLEDLASGLGVNNRNKDFIQAAVEEKLGFHMTSSSNPPRFRHRIIFNAREQKFEVVYGITVEDLRNLIDIDANAPREANRLARAHIVNAFSMCDAQGTNARPVDFHSFQGMFTPEFYPRRFALKDSIYSQRLDVLAHLLYYVLLRYDKCHPPVTYCELSVGVGDLTRPWVFDVLCSFPTSKQSSDQPSTKEYKKTSSFRELLEGGHFPSLEDAVTKNRNSQQQSMSLIPKCTYKLLAGFNRQKVQTSFFTNQKEAIDHQKEAIDLLNEAPQIAIHLMLKEINKSASDECFTEKDDIFYRHVKELEEMKKSAENNKTNFYHWVVGLDLFGDEMGFPYCPFVTRDFIRYVLHIRANYNPSFGLRIHCGENVPFADANTPAYRHFAAHMYIVFRCLRYLQHELEYGIRIGHGIAFQHILDGTMSPSKHRKSSVLLAEIQNHAPDVFKTIAFEVNITSNEYLLGQALRKGDYRQTLQLDTLLKLGAPIILATDDDGVWPIDNCSQNCPSHHSLSGEYCRAISSQIIQDVKILEKMFENMRTFRFYSTDKKMQMPKADISMLPHDTRASPVVIHPDVIKFIMSRCRQQHQMEGSFYNAFEHVYPSDNTEGTNNMPVFNEELKELETWKQTCSRLAPIAYVLCCAKNLETNPELSVEARNQYHTIFDKPPDVEKVLKEWNSVYQQFIKPNIIVQIQRVSTNLEEVTFLSEESLVTDNDEKRRQEQYNSIVDKVPDASEVLKKWKSAYELLIRSNIMDQSQWVSTNSEKDVFFSEGFLTIHNDETRPMEGLISYVKGHYDKTIRVYAFTRHLNVKPTISKIKTVLKEPGCSNLHVCIYSNKDKEKYVDFNLSNKIQVEINPSPSERTDHNGKPQQNGLYVVCPHASAATAFLHFISKELSEDDKTKSSVSDAAENRRSYDVSNISPSQNNENIQSTQAAANLPLPNIIDNEKCDNTLNNSSSLNDDNIKSSTSDIHGTLVHTTQTYYGDSGKQPSTNIDDDVKRM
jgi:adenosine deaminase